MKEKFAESISAPSTYLEDDSSPICRDISSSGYRLNGPRSELWLKDRHEEPQEEHGTQFRVWGGGAIKKTEIR